MHRDKAAKIIRNQTIQTRLTTAFIGLAVGPLLIVGALAIWQGLSYQKESIRLQQQLAERVSVEVEGFITGLENDLRLAVKLQGVQNLGDRQTFSSLSVLLSFNNLYEELALLDNNGNELNKVARLEIITDDGLDNRAGTPDFEIPFTTGQTYFSPVRFDTSTGEPLLTISIPIFDERLGEPQGALSAVVRLKSIWDLIAQVPLGDHQSVYIVDSDGRIVAHRNPSVVLRGTIFNLPPKPGISTGLDSQTVILAMDEIKLGGQTLTIVAEQALSKALELPINLLKTTLAVSFFSFTFAGLIGLRSVRRIVKPIQDLAATAHAIRDGDLTRQAPVDQSDEVGELAETFNTMTAQLNQTMQGLERELDERHRIAEELRLSEIRIRAMFTAIPDTKFVLDKDAVILEFIPGVNFKPLLPPDQFLNKRIEEVLPEELSAQIHFYLTQVLETRQLQIFEYELSPTNNKRFFEARMTYSGTDQALAVIRDITDQKQAKTERENLIRELEAKNKELDDFTYSVSHDLKSPLITLRGFIHYIEEDIHSTNMERLQHDVQRVNESIEKMDRLINELLELSRIGRIINPPIDVSFSEIVDDAISRVQGRLNANHIKVEVRGDLPEIHVDRNRLVQVIQNLLDNSAKFMGSQEHPQIEIGMYANGGRDVFYVKDNGIGIKPEFHEKVFGVFDKLNPGTDGTGVGLALVKRIVEVHGGKIWIESDGTGSGTTICFTLGEIAAQP